MATGTTNYNFQKPAASDTTAVRTDYNTFLDLADTTIKAVADAAVAKALYDANSLLYATADNTPVALSVGASTFVGRKASGDISAMSVTEVTTLLSDTMLPWLISIDPYHTTTNTNWNTIDTTAEYINNARKVTNGSQNASIQWDVVIAAGTWSIELIHETNSIFGIADVQIDDVSVGSVDMYSAGSVVIVRTSVTGVAVAATGKKTLKLIMSTKHASSSNYYGSLQSVRLLRTA